MSSKKWTIPILGPLIPDGLSSGTMLLVEYDPEGQWLFLSRSMVASRVKSGLRAVYGTMMRSREDVITSLTRLGVDVDVAEKAGLVRIDDHHSATLSQEKNNPGFVGVEDRYIRVGSPRVADWSIDMLRSLRGTSHLTKWGTDQSDVLAIADSFSPLLRFNEEKVFLEWMETRDLPLNRNLGRINLIGISRGIHSESLYARLEGALDGLIEVRALERDDEIKNMLRVRNLKGQSHDARWHELKVNSNGEVTLAA